MTATYRHVDATVHDLCREVLARHHDHLRSIRVEFVFRSEAARTGNKTVLGKARKISGLQAFLSDEEAQPFFVIELAEDVWETLTPRGRRALVDHELLHCRVKYNDEGEAVPYLAPHDVEEFGAIVVRHGLWKPDLEYFGAAMRNHVPDEDVDGD